MVTTCGAFFSPNIKIQILFTVLRIFRMTKFNVGRICLNIKTSRENGGVLKNMTSK